MTLAWSPVDGFSGLSRLRLMGALRSDDPDAREDATVIVRAILQRRGFPADDIPEDRLEWAMGAGWVRWEGIRWMPRDAWNQRLTKWHAVGPYPVTFGLLKTLCGLPDETNRDGAMGSLAIPHDRWLCKSCLRAWNRFLFGSDR